VLRPDLESYFLQGVRC